MSKRKEVTDEIEVIEVIEEWKKSPSFPPDDTSGGDEKGISLFTFHFFTPHFSIISLVSFSEPYIYSPPLTDIT